VWLKISGPRGAGAVSELHFKRIAARAMRQVLIDDARRRQASKRGGPNGVLVTMDFSKAPTIVAEDELIALDSSLDKLALMNPRQATVVESRFFGGLEMAEIAELLGIPKLPCCATGVPTKPGSPMRFGKSNGSGPLGTRPGVVPLRR
jgi:RNA polymerase sigma factor (TIGR02999 family)